MGPDFLGTFESSAGRLDILTAWFGCRLGGERLGFGPRDKGNAPEGVGDPCSRMSKGASPSFLQLAPTSKEGLGVYLRYPHPSCM